MEIELRRLAVSSPPSLTSKESANYGGLGEFIVVEARYSALVPEGVSSIDAGCAGSNAQRAIALVRDCNVQEGDRVLVLGASGGMRSMMLTVKGLELC